MIDLAFWANRRVFLTGHTGFKGAWLSLMLSRLKATTIGYALPPPDGPNLFETAGVEPHVVHRTGDIADFATLSHTMRAAQPEIIIHMAAQPLVKAGYADPVETYRTNVMGTVNVLEAARHIPSVRAIVVVTTDKCYENRDIIWGYRETDRLGGHDPYSNSKACAELVTAAFRDSYFAHINRGGRRVAVVSARAGNVIGGGDFAADRIVPDAMRAFAAGRPLHVRNPVAIRPWQHVLDPLGGYLMLAQLAFVDATAAAGGWNFGPVTGEERSVEAVVTRLSETWGNGARWVRDHAEHAHEARQLRLDSAKAREYLGWTPLHDFEAMIDATVLWYRGAAEGADMRELTLGQADHYIIQRMKRALPAAAPVHQEVLHATG